MVSLEFPVMGELLGSCCAPYKMSLGWLVQIRVASGRASRTEQFLSLWMWKWVVVVFHRAVRAGSGRKVSLSPSRSHVWRSSVRKSFELLDW
jgi:hypothetical protein